MMEPQPTRTTFALDSPMSDDQLQTLLSPSYTVETQKTVTHQVRVYDTFDWDLWFEGLILVQEQDRLRLYSRSRDSASPPMSTTLTGDLPRFPSELPNGRLKQRLVKVCGLRALQCRAELTLQEQPGTVRNTDGKIVVRLTQSEDAEHGHVLTVRALRGFQQDQTRLEELLRGHGLVETNSGDLITRLSLALSPPADPPNKPTVDFTGSDPSRDVLLKMIRAFYRIARIQEQGLIDDIDTEFLHQYRVAIRKARSAIQQLREVLPEADRQRLKNTLGDMARRTNLLRDLDVYLLEEQSYRQLLPESLRSGLDVMFRDYADRRDAEQQAVAKHLSSKAYRSLTDEIDAYLDPDNHVGPSEEASTPVVKLAAQKIRKRYRRIVKQSMQIDDDTPDEVIHEIRIDCKKLRYLLEFFSQLFDTAHVDPLVKALKKIQGVLGTFNDLSVQQESVLAYATEKENEQGALPMDLAMAVGGLVAVLSREQAEIRNKVIASFASFSSDQIKQHVETMTRKLPSQPPTSEESDS